jgi:hypothetical protein
MFDNEATSTTVPETTDVGCFSLQSQRQGQVFHLCYWDFSLISLPDSFEIQKPTNRTGKKGG